MRSTFYSGAIAVIAFLLADFSQAGMILFEDFEDDTVTYTSNLADALDDIGSLDYYGRLSPGTALPAATVSYGNLLGSGYYGVQDTDSAVGGGGPTSGNDLVQLNWTGIDTSGFSDLRLSWFVAEDDSSDGNEDWDSNTSFQLAVQLDGGGFDTIFAVESELVGGSDQTNEEPRVDTDFDGIGDGVAITNVFTEFASLLADADTVDIRVQFFELNAFDEDLALDNLLLQGNQVATVPEPASSILFLGTLVGGVLLRRRRD